MKNRFALTAFYLVPLMVCLAVPAYGQVIADYQAEFNPKSPSTGWSYHWNPADVKIGESAKYSKLNARGNWVMQVSSDVPFKDESIGDGQWLRLQKEKSLWATGASKIGSNDDTAHYVIAAYTIQANEAGVLKIANSSAVRDVKWGTGDVKVYVNDDVIDTVNIIKDQPTSFDLELGTLKEGDVVYVALGSKTKGSLTANITYQIVKAP